MKKSILSFVILGLTTFATAALAVSNDRISQSASGCREFSGSVGRWNNGAIGNTSSGSSARVACPITRIAHADNLRVRVFVLDDNPNWDYGKSRSADVFCSIYDNNIYGDGWHWSNWVGTGSHTGGTSLTINDGNLRHSASGAIHMLCDIPKDPSNGGVTKIIGYTSERN